MKRNLLYILSVCIVLDARLEIVSRRTIAFLKLHGVRVCLTGVPHYPQYAGRWSAQLHFLADPRNKLLPETA
jgi:hypothetical protein